MSDIHQLYKKAAQFHGHACPGLAIGVRAAAIALEALEVTDIQSHGLYCVAESSACYIDGIQVLFGTTMGKGNLSFHPSGKSAFSFYNEDKALRLVTRDFPKELSRPELIEFILTAPAEELFSQTALRFPRPEKKERPASALCPVCGEKCNEDKLQLVDGRLVCIDCACGLESK